MLPYVRDVRRTYYEWVLNEFMGHCTAADGTVLLEALLDHAAAIGFDPVTHWPTSAKYSETLLRCVLKSGNVEYMRVVLRRGLYDHTLRADTELAHALKEDWPVSDGMRELLAQYLA